MLNRKGCRLAVAGCCRQLQRRRYVVAMKAPRQPVTEEQVRTRLLDPYHQNEVIRRFQACGDNTADLDVIKQSGKGSAILMPLCMVDDRLSFLYIMRSHHQPTHAGQVGFPGGRIHSDDQSFEYTALRETYEELGIQPEHVDVWTKMAPAKSTNVSYIIAVLGFIKDFDMKKLNIDKREVHDVFTLPITDLLDPRKHGTTKFRWNMEMPVFVNPHRNVWGFTSMYTNVFLTAAFPESHSLNTFTRHPNVDKTYLVN